MTQQVEPETQQAMSLRTLVHDTLANAFVGNIPFSQVPAQPYLNAPAGPLGFPSTTLLETKGLTFYGTDNPPGNVQDTASIQMQINVLESLRRSQLARRQTRREMLVHLAYDFDQADLNDAAALKDFVSTNKVATP